MQTVAQSEAFEEAIKDDLRRGLEDEKNHKLGDRGLFVRWTAAEDMRGKKWEARDGIIVGYRDQRLIRVKDDRHMLTIAGSRAGKGTSLIIPNLLFYEGSAVVIDPKGELAARTAGRRGAGAMQGKSKGLSQAVYVLDPFGEAGLGTASFNPMSALDPKSADFIDDIGIFADALITHSEHGDRHWSESAQGLVRALIVMVMTDPRFRDRKHLITVRQLLMLTDPMIEKIVSMLEDRNPGTQVKAEQALIRLLKEQDNDHAYICVGTAEQLDSMGDKERGSVLSSARTQTQWLDSPRMKAVLVRNDFDLRTLKQTKMTIYLSLPATRMATHSRWLRLVVLLSLAMIERDRTMPLLPVLFVLDEFPVLGHMEALEKAAGLMAGYGVKLWPIVQNIGQLKQHYNRSWETFIANAGVVTAFGIGDSETLKALSEWLGQTAIVETNDLTGNPGHLRAGGDPLGRHNTTVPLLAAHEVRIAFARGKRRMLVFNVEESPAIVHRMEYFEEGSICEGLYDPDPRFLKEAAA